MSRIERFRPNAMDEGQQEVYRAIAGGARSKGPQLFSLMDDDGVLAGPFNAFLLSPEVGMPLQSLGSAIRYRTSLSDRGREIAILLVARDVASRFEWYAHERIGKFVGVTDAELTEIKRSGRLDPVDSREKAIVDFVVEILEGGDVPDETYDFAQQHLGAAGIFELVTLIGYYRLLALQMKVFRSDSVTDQ